MKRLLNTLFVTTQGAYLYREGDTVIIKVEQEKKIQVPIHNLASIVCFGNVACSSPVMDMCGKGKVSLVFLTENGKFLARVHGPVSGNVLLRREQYRKADDKALTLNIARTILFAKILNSRQVLMRAARECEQESNDYKRFNSVNDCLSRINHALKQADNLDKMRGKEGEAAQTYFSVIDLMIRSHKESFCFNKRSRRPPIDNVNALLSFVYTLLAHDVVSALETVGLDPAVGFLHAERPGRPSLALDIMEEFRAYLADRLVLTLINRQQIHPKGFEQSETGAVTMNDATRKEVLVTYQKRKQEEIMHPFLKEKVSLGHLPFIQALLMARYIRGDLDGYPPFFWRG